ncbi:MULTISPECIES: endo-1,4-beta-xylanase [Ruminococcus]|uniref:Beta-xylanase n=1 Tax=Ruminococcus albus (strain ATCC 27210 / DSM 20455 / JCM 14654 / NCDO 2250 / 7) TaxID=697329 RepID=E6UFI1_RUMA7|nr:MULTISPECIES: endo-1,4-beta-xylanase [Ruminococcus]ADU21885.1 Endo-1,4-beta-xylanase [Ruminococcus albus 7 = DSM 20455]
MNGNLVKKLAAYALCLTMASSMIPGAAFTATAESASPAFSTDFEDGNVSMFSKRGDSDTSVIKVVEDSAAPSGSKVMSVTGRSKSWNGPSIALEGILEPYVKYDITVKVKAQWYNTVCISMQHTPAGSDSPQYTNLAKAVSQGDYVELSASFSYGSDEKDVSLYIETTGDANDLYIDDLTICESPNNLDLTAPSLKNVYGDMFKFGTATTVSELAPKSTKALIKKHFNSLTAGNELKPDSVLDQQACLALAASGDDENPQVTLDAAKPILDFARDNNIPMRGHVLVWHQQTPIWFFKENYDANGEWVSKEKMLRRMENYIKNVFTAVKKEYPDVDFYAWDVVNECFTDAGAPRNPGVPDSSNGYQSSPWVQIFGDNSFIKPAFIYAKKYAPSGCKLYYNDYNEYMQKSDAIVKLCQDINSSGHYIDGIGMQSHLNVTNNGGSDPFPSVSMYRQALDKFSKTGLDIQITELDATVNNKRFDLQAKYYSDIMDAIVDYKDYVSAVVVWGTTDDLSWRADRDPLLFNQDYSVKPCFESIVDGIEYTETENENENDPDPVDTYPTNVKANYSTKYHQIQFVWDKVKGADKYGIAVYLAGKWRVQTTNITNNSYVTPKNLTPGMTYKVAVAARVNGKWDTTNAIKNAITVTVQ